MDTSADAMLHAKPILERFHLDRKAAVVTGGGQGIGRVLANAGASVAIADVDGARAELVARELIS